jgi:hypothetical protein
MDADDKLKWTLEIKEDPTTGEPMLEFPPEVLAKTGWVEGDTLVWRELANGDWTLEKKSNDQ